MSLYDQINKLIAYKAAGWSVSSPFPDNYFQEIANHNLQLIKEHSSELQTFLNLDKIDFLITKTNELFNTGKMTGVVYSSIYLYLVGEDDSVYGITYNEYLTERIGNYTSNLLADYNYMILPFINGESAIASFYDINLSIANGIFIAGIPLIENIRVDSTILSAAGFYSHDLGHIFAGEILDYFDKFTNADEFYISHKIPIAHELFYTINPMPSNNWLQYMLFIMFHESDILLFNFSEYDINIAEHLTNLILSPDLKDIVVPENTSEYLYNKTIEHNTEFPVYTDDMSIEDRMRINKEFTKKLPKIEYSPLDSPINVLNWNVYLDLSLQLKDLGLNLESVIMINGVRKINYDAIRTEIYDKFTELVKQYNIKNIIIAAQQKINLYDIIDLNPYHEY